VEETCRGRVSWGPWRKTRAVGWKQRARAESGWGGERARAAPQPPSSTQPQARARADAHVRLAAASPPPRAMQAPPPDNAAWQRRSATHEKMDARAVPAGSASSKAHPMGRHRPCREPLRRDARRRRRRRCTQMGWRPRGRRAAAAVAGRGGESRGGAGRARRSWPGPPRTPTPCRGRYTATAAPRKRPPRRPSPSWAGALPPRSHRPGTRLQARGGPHPSPNATPLPARPACRQPARGRSFLRRAQWRRGRPRGWQTGRWRSWCGWRSACRRVRQAQCMSSSCISVRDFLLLRAVQHFFEKCNAGDSVSASATAREPVIL